MYRDVMYCGFDQREALIVKEYLRRANLRRWFNTSFPISGILVALNLLVDEGIFVETRFNDPLIHYKDKAFVITKVLANTLKSLHLVKWLKNEKSQTFFVATEQAKEYFSEFLALHDAMHIGDSDEIRPGIYEHFKGKDRLYNILWTSRDSNTGELTVEYQPLHKGDGGANNREFLHDHRSLAEFTELIYRPDVHNYFGPRWKLISAHAGPMIAYPPTLQQ